MKYRNFDPDTNQPITAVELLERISTDVNFKDKPFDITTLLSDLDKNKSVKNDSVTTKKEENLTGYVLQKYNRIASLINASSIKKKQRNSNSNSTSSSSKIPNIPEFDTYLDTKYPFAKIKTKEKYTILLKQRINELIQYDQQSNNSA